MKDDGMLPESWGINEVAVTGTITIIGAKLLQFFGPKLWEHWRNRVRLRTSYNFTGARGEPDTITIINISPGPVKVGGWKLQWQPRGLRWKPKARDVTPDGCGGYFKIEGRSAYTISIPEEEKFDWGHRASSGRKLMITLDILGRLRPVTLKIMDGT